MRRAVQGSGRRELQVGLSSTSLLASATHVSHRMRWHQVLKEHAARDEECCSPHSMNRSSAARKGRGRGEKKKKEKRKSLKIDIFVVYLTFFLSLFSCLQQKAKTLIHVLCGRGGGSWGGDERRGEKILSVLSSSCPDAGLRSTFPIRALSLSGVESRREGAREQDREGESE